MAQRGGPGGASRVCLPTSASRAQTRLGPAARYSATAVHRPTQAATFASVASSSHSGLLSGGADALLQFGGGDAEPVPPGSGHPEHAHAARAGEPLAAGG